MKKRKRGLIERSINHTRLKIQSIFEKKAKKLSIDSTKPTYYIIRRDGHGAGFFSNYLWVLGHIVYAKENGMIPVVDFKHYPTLYSEKKAVNGTKNSWNYYFEDVSPISLRDAYKSKNFVLADFEYLNDYCERFCGKYGFPIPQAVEYYHPIISQNIKVRNDIQKQLEKELSLLGITNNTLAVHYRGTDMKRNDNWLHEQTAEVSDYIEATRSLMASHQYENIFLATDEEGIINLYKETFGSDKIISYSAFRDNDSEGLVGIHSSKATRKNHKYLLGYEVLRDAYTLSKCKSLICGYSNVANVAILWNNNRYENMRLIERNPST